MRIWHVNDLQQPELRVCRDRRRVKAEAERLGEMKTILAELRKGPPPFSFSLREPGRFVSFVLLPDRAASDGCQWIMITAEPETQEAADSVLAAAQACMLGHFRVPGKEGQ
jgi:hypothetical protein